MQKATPIWFALSCRHLDIHPEDEDWQVHESARMANGAVDHPRRTNDRFGELAKAAARIGGVVELMRVSGRDAWYVFR